MTALRAGFTFGVRDLLVGAQLLGSSEEVVRGCHKVVVRLPSEERSSASAAEQPSEQELAALFPREEMSRVGAIATTSVEMVPDPDVVKVGLLRVEVSFEADVAAAEFEDDGPERPDFEAARVVLREAFEVASEVLEKTIAWVRVRGRQPWLGLEGESPSGIGSSDLVDLDAERELPVALTLETTVIHQIAPEQVLDAERLGAVMEAVRTEMSPGLAQNLLADARFLAQHAEPTDLPRAMLLAAIAAEVGAKQALRDSASPAQAELVELLLSNPRDFSMAAVALFDRPMQIVLGASLREDDKELFKRVDKLFSRRNGLAHRGEVPEEAQAIDGIKAAGEALRWVAKRADAGSESS